MPGQVRACCGAALFIGEELIGLQLECLACRRRFVVQPPGTGHAQRSHAWRSQARHGAASVRRPHSIQPFQPVEEAACTYGVAAPGASDSAG